MAGWATLGQKAFSLTDLLHAVVYLPKLIVQYGLQDTVCTGTSSVGCHGMVYLGIHIRRVAESEARLIQTFGQNQEMVAHLQRRGSGGPRSCVQWGGLGAVDSTRFPCVRGCPQTSLVSPGFHFKEGFLIACTNNGLHLGHLPFGTSILQRTLISSKWCLICPNKSGKGRKIRSSEDRVWGALESPVYKSSRVTASTDLTLSSRHFSIGLRSHLGDHDVLWKGTNIFTKGGKKCDLTSHGKEQKNIWGS